MDNLQREELEEVKDLEELDLSDEETLAEAKQRFKVTDANSANWCFRKIKAFNEQITENTKIADAEKYRIEKWLKKENNNATNGISFFENLLTEYFLEQKMIDSKYKLSTPYGKLSSRKQVSKWEYDEEKLIKWLEDNKYDDYIKIEKSPKKADIKKVFKDGVDSSTGENIEGIEIVPQEDKVVIKVEE